MNWFVNGITKRVIKEDDDRCKHLKVGEVAPRYTAECDLLGRETYYMCVSCWEKLQAEIAGTEVICSDCKGAFPQRDTTEWKWYDFDHQQGDEALCICNNCISLPTHLNRVENDKLAYAREFPEDAEY
ncbi:hypothetical protein pEaSNUABM29_00051 [Erwinia phage pEa_SNUABM_29]|nr:hypothetical protein pEaSNUABM29_00051 [Erwinia phage pEa_SNUABM_29]